MSKKNIEESVESSEQLEDWVRERIQGFGAAGGGGLLGRRKSERRRAVDTPSG